MGTMKSMKTAKKAMKSMKSKKTTMKAMRKKRAMKYTIGARSSVLRGIKEKTKTGLKKDDLMRSKTNKVVTKKKHAAGKKAYKNVEKFAKAVKAARKALGIKGFVPIGGKSARGQALLKKTRSLYKK